MLTAEQRRELATTGIIRAPGAISRETADAMLDQVWAFFAKRGIERDDPSTWPQGYGSKNQGLKKQGTFDAFATDDTHALLDELLGAGRWIDPGSWGPALVTFPQPGPWVLPHKIWHFDLAGRGDPNQPAVARLFGYVSDVGPEAGGTLVVEGSHELVRRMVAASPDHDAGSSSDVRKKLKASHPWFAALARAGGDRVAQFMTEGDEIDGVRVRVVELTGAAGDVVAMLPWTMHNLAMNCAPTPRFMVTHSVHRA